MPYLLFKLHSFANEIIIITNVVSIILDQLLQKLFADNMQQNKMCYRSLHSFLQI
jgi:hypothetical protein